MSRSRGTCESEDNDGIDPQLNPPSKKNAINGIILKDCVETSYTCYVLQLFIEKATNIDPFNGSFLPTKGRGYGFYFAIASNEKGVDFRTTTAIGRPEPFFNHYVSLKLDGVRMAEFLNLELMEENCDKDVTTSGRNVVVGRARTPLSPEKLGEWDRRRVELVEQVGHGTRVAGFLHLALKLTSHAEKEFDNN